MPAAALPRDEPDRLAALAALRLMDTAPDLRLDGLVRLAADLYDVPIALVSLLDEERQWFKAAVGLPLRQTRREDAFCAHAILEPDQVMVVEDALLDARFAQNPLVVGDPGIRFYAGATVRAPTGQPLGTLCLIDREPRQLDLAGRQRLQGLAEGVAALFELHGTTIELRRSATHDRLTGLANRAMFEKRVEQAVAGALAGRPCGLLLIDLDRFRHVNEAQGHAQGDTVLREVAARLVRIVRASDLVGRVGGGTFAVLMADPADRAAMLALSARLREVLEAPVLLEAERPASHPQIEISIGFALCPLDATEAGALQREANLALYHDKSRSVAGQEAGPSSPTAVAPHAPASAQPVSLQPVSLQPVSLQPVSLQPGPPPGIVGPSRAAARTRRPSPGQDLDTDLRAAMETGALELHWQPIMAARDFEVCGFEALQRWTRPSHGPVSPSLFIPVAEASGQIVAMDRWTINTACARAATWRDGFSVSVNLSAHWFGGSEVIDLVAAALGRSGLAPSRLCVEVTERSVIASHEAARAQIEALHGLGVRVALDDFGTGFSSLAYLRDLPFDVLKLDRSFVSAMGPDRRSNAVACSIISLGQRLGMSVCAEGIETEAQLAMLRDNGCDQLQGYLLGRPAPEPQFQRFRAGQPARPAACRGQQQAKH